MANLTIRAKTVADTIGLPAVWRCIQDGSDKGMWADHVFTTVFMDDEDLVDASDHQTAVGLIVRLYKHLGLGSPLVPLASYWRTDDVDGGGPVHWLELAEGVACIVREPGHLEGSTLCVPSMPTEGNWHSVGGGSWVMDDDEVTIRAVLAVIEHIAASPEVAGG